MRILNGDEVMTVIDAGVDSDKVLFTVLSRFPDGGPVLVEFVLYAQDRDEAQLLVRQLYNEGKLDVTQYEVELCS